MTQTDPLRVVALTGSISRRAGGPFESIRGLTLGLKATGMDVHVIGIRDESTADDIAAWSPILPVAIRRLGPTAFGYAPGYERHLKRIDPELVHCHGIWMYSALVSLRWGRRTRRPYVVSPHGMLDPWAVRHMQWKKTIARHCYQWEQLRRAACVRVLCNAERDAVRGLGFRVPVCTIPNGVSLPADTVLPAPWDDEAVRGRHVLLYVGRIHPKKNAMGLLRAWDHARQQSKSAREWVLIVVGWDQLGYEGKLRAFVDERGLSNSVVFPGPLYGDAKLAAYGHASAFALPSRSEGLPVSVLEAWSHRLPVLLTPHCNLPEGVACGAAIETSLTTDDLTRGLLQLMAMTPDERGAMGERGRSLVEQKFTWTRIATRMAEVYRWLLGGGVPPDDVEPSVNSA